MPASVPEFITRFPSTSSWRIPRWDGSAEIFRIRKRPRIRSCRLPMFAGLTPEQQKRVAGSVSQFAASLAVS